MKLAAVAAIVVTLMASACSPTSSFTATLADVRPTARHVLLVFDDGHVVEGRGEVYAVGKRYHVDVYGSGNTASARVQEAQR